MLNLTIISSLFVEKSLGVESRDPTTATTTTTSVEYETPRALNAVTDKFKLWAQGTVPYDDTDYTLSERDRRDIRDALDRLQQKTGQCVKFVRSTSGHRVRVSAIQDNGCNAQVGKNRFAQTVNLGSGCMTNGIIQHEFMHALGIYHTQSRSDRDKHVRIDTNQVEKDFVLNFEKFDENVVSHHSLPYDYDSVMHYGAYDFAISWKPVVEARVTAKQSAMGQRNGVSIIDALLIQSMYGCITQNDCKGYKNNNYCNNEFRPWMDNVCKGHCSDASPKKKAGIKTTNNSCTCIPGLKCEERPGLGYTCYVGLDGDSGCDDVYYGFSKKACDLSPTKPSFQKVFLEKLTPSKEAKKTTNNSCKCYPGFGCNWRKGLGYSCYVGDDLGCYDAKFKHSKKACEV